MPIQSEGPAYERKKERQRKKYKQKTVIQAAAAAEKQAAKRERNRLSKQRQRQRERMEREEAKDTVSDLPATPRQPVAASLPRPPKEISKLIVCFCHDGDANWAYR